MKNWRDALLPLSATVREAIETIDLVMQLALVVDEQNRLLGIVTDRDVRRGMLRQVPLDSTIESIMNKNPTVLFKDDDRENILEVFAQSHYAHIPVLDAEHRVVNVDVIDSSRHASQQSSWVVLMAEGIDVRLHPLTEEYPKPLLKVENKPLLEMTLEHFIGHGFNQFYLSVNYQSEVIEQYFGDGSQWGVEIRYLRGKAPMGTAGALSLLPEMPRDPVFVMNENLLTQINLRHLLDFHKQHHSQGTMCVREHEVRIHHDVTRIENHQITQFDEKPIKYFFVDAGIYVLEPEVLELIPKGAFYNMTDLFTHLIGKEYQLRAFPIREYWLDVGDQEDPERATGDFKEISL